MVRCETPKRKLQLMNDSIKKLRRNLQEKMETVHEDLHRPPDLLDQRGNSLCARVVKDGLTCVGPYRSSKSAAEADVKSLVEAGRVSADAVASVSRELREAELGERQFENFDTVMQSHMQTLLFPQGSASSGLSKTSQKRLQRTKQKEDYAVALDACKLLVADYEANEALSKEASAVWLRDLGLQFRLDYGSRPLGTLSTLWLAQSGQQLLAECCRAVFVSLSTIAKRFVQSHR